MQVSALLFALRANTAPTCDAAKDRRCSKMTSPPTVGSRDAKIRSASYEREAYVQKLRSCEDEILADAAELMSELGH